MYPILFQFGPITIRTFGFLIIMGFVVALFVLKTLATNSGLRMAFIIDYLFGIIIATLAGARLIPVLLKWELFKHQWIEIVYIWDGQLSIIGALIIGTLYFYYICLKHHQPFLHWMDTVIPSVLTLTAFGYVGLAMSEAGLSGKALGNPTNLPWGMTVDFLNSPFAGTSVHPIALYLAFLSGVIAFTVLVLRVRGLKFPNGTYSLCAVAAFSLGLVITELLKWETSYTIFGYNMTLIGATIIAVASTAGLISSIKRKTVRHDDLEQKA